ASRVSGDPADGRLDQGSLGEGETASGVERAGTTRDERGRVATGGVRDAREDGEQDQLEVGGLVHGVAGAGDPVDEPRGLDRHVVEDRRAGSGELLPESVPIVFDRDTVRVGRDDREAAAVLSL